MVDQGLGACWDGMKKRTEGYRARLWLNLKRLGAKQRSACYWGENNKWAKGYKN